MFEFPRNARLNTRAEFERVRAQGRSAGGRWFKLSAIETGEHLPARLGIITPRRCGGATQRSRFRRLIREIFRRQRPQLPAGLWLVAIARPGAGEAPFQSVRDEWLRLISRLSIVDGSR